MRPDAANRQEPAADLSNRAAARMMELLLAPEDEGADASVRVGGYVVEREIGGGGGGTVYLAHRPGLDLPVALKVLSRPLGEGRSSKRGWRELDLLADLRLACVPRLLDYGTHEGRLYLATEYVNGLPLDLHCSRQGLDRRARAELLAAAADAVHALHEKQVLHRDLKPSNILVGEDGRPAIIDLGVATFAGVSPEGTAVTIEGSAIGTPAYMAPEQARGERDRITTRTDVYALGATGYQLFVGHTPHDAPPLPSARTSSADGDPVLFSDSPTRDAPGEPTGLAGLLRIAGNEPPRHPRRFDPTLPRPLATVLFKAVSPKPEDRYASAASFAADLRRWIKGDPVHAEEPGPWLSALRWVGRHPAVATLALCVTIAVLVTGGTWLATWWLNFRPDRLRLSAEGQEVELVSIGGTPLHRWERDRYGSLKGFEMVRRPPEFGGGRIAIIGYVPDVFAAAPPVSGLCAFALDDPGAPLWTSGVEPPVIEMPPHPNFRAAQRFSLALFRLCDIFPDSPGPEIVAVFSHAHWSPTVVRVYDLGGNIRYEVWHDGYIESVHWLPGPGLLVCAGDNSEVYWRGRGSGETAVFPIVVMGLRPRDGERGGWVSTPSRPGDTDPAWYRCLLPAAKADAFRSKNVGAAPQRDPDRFFCFRAFGADRRRYVMLTLNPAGEIVDRSASAEYGQNAGPDSGLPEIDTLVLGELPPIIPGGEVFRPGNR